MEKSILRTLILACALVLCAPTYSAQAQLRGVVEEKTVFYVSHDANGDTLTLSGLLSVPVGREPKGVILVPHYTIAADKEAPSNNFPGEAKLLREDYVLIMPDYQGYGASRHRVHPYLRGDLTAQQCIDMLLIAPDELRAMGVEERCDSIILLGYSQGGATVLWIQKLIETQYPQIAIRRCYAGSGPHDVASIYDESVRTNRTAMPMGIPLLVMGTSEAYGLNLRREDFFTPKLDACYDEYIGSKKLGVMQLFFKMFDGDVSHWLSANGMNKTHPETRKMYDGLLRSGLVHIPMDNTSPGNDTIAPGWTPKAPVYVFQSYDDKVVTVRNAESLQHFWRDLPNVTWDFGHYGSHMRSMGIFLDKVNEFL